MIPLSHHLITLSHEEICQIKYNLIIYTLRHHHDIRRLPKLLINDKTFVIAELQSATQLFIKLYKHKTAQVELEV